MSSSSLGLSHRIRGALDGTRASAFHSWPVTDELGVEGVVSLSTLQKALQESGGASRRLKEFVDAREFPDLHGDHPLSVALGRMGTTHLDVLPVVSRADVHKLEGVVTSHDVLSFYGFAGAVGS